jgi:hypothetical protein
MTSLRGSWANLYAPGTVHRAHSHPDNYLSAVYYVRTWPVCADQGNGRDRPLAPVELRAANGRNAATAYGHCRNLASKFRSVQVIFCAGPYA